MVKNIKITIRKATVWDAKAITDMYAKMISEIKIEGEGAGGGIINLEYFFIELITKIKTPTACVLVAVDGAVDDAEKGEKIVGFIMNRIRMLEYTSEVIQTCDHLYIEKGHRNNGILERLIAESYKIFEQYKPKMTDFTTVYDPKLVRFWGKKGYKPVHITFRGTN